MKNIYAAASLIAVILLVIGSFSVPVQAYTPPSVYLTKVMLICNGRFTSATATVTLTHDGQTIGSITLTCSNPTTHRATGTITTQLKPNDLHKEITVRVGDGSYTCRPGHDYFIPWSSWGCHFLRGSALLIVRPTR